MSNGFHGKWPGAIRGGFLGTVLVLTIVTYYLPSCPSAAGTEISAPLSGNSRLWASRIGQKSGTLAVLCQTLSAIIAPFVGRH